MAKVFLINPRRKKELTRDQVESRKDKAVRFLRDVADNDALADEIDGLSVEEYAKRKGFALTNPTKKEVKSAMNRNPTEQSDDVRGMFDTLGQKMDDLTKALKSQSKGRSARTNSRNPNGEVSTPQPPEPPRRAMPQTRQDDLDVVIDSLIDMQGLIDDGRDEEAQEILDGILSEYD